MEENILVYYDVGAINGRSFPFEDGKNDQYLKQWIGFDPNFEDECRVDGKDAYYGYAVSDIEGTVKYHISNRVINNSLFVANKEKFIGIHGRQMVLPKRSKDIRCRRLENVVSENNGEIDILKIDAHGSEYPILQGVGKYLTGIIILHVEIWEQDMYIGAIGGKETNNFIISSGFEPIWVVGESLKNWVDVIYLNTHCLGPKFDLCKKIYLADEKSDQKKREAYKTLTEHMGWTI